MYPLALYKKLLKRRRAEQLAVIKGFQESAKYDQAAQTISALGERVFPIIQDSRAVMESSPFIPGVSDFPLDENIRDALSSIIENTAMFSELILRFPDRSVAMLKTNNIWNVLLQWAISYCYQVKYLLDESTIKVLSLASQELNHVPRDPGYVNPYRRAQQKKNQLEEEQQLPKKKRKKLKKGPRLHDEF
ncbi:hypothetical protein HUJ04_009700 [Dendroctonus ponderosae]|nr:hypothetical protein HUJ04_009700 [Dendroctonus ponderosae]